MQSLARSGRRPVCPQCLHRLSNIHQQTRNATLIKRPKRPYTFTQLVQLSDGSAYLQRTTSPAPVYKSTKDTRNTSLWNPSSEKLLNVEDDEAGRLRTFRQRFGRGFDAQGKQTETLEETEPIDAVQEEKKARKISAYGDEDDSLLDLITSYGTGKQSNTRSGGVAYAPPSVSEGRKK